MPCRWTAAWRELQVEFQNRDRVEASLLAVLNVSHIEEFAACDDSGGYPVKQGIAAFENLESFDGAKIAGQAEPNNSRCHKGVLYCDQGAAVKIETVNRCKAQVRGTRDRSCNVSFQIHDRDAIEERRDIKQAAVRRECEIGRASCRERV